MSNTINQQASDNDHDDTEDEDEALPPPLETFNTFKYTNNTNKRSVIQRNQPRKRQRVERKEKKEKEESQWRYKWDNIHMEVAHYQGWASNEGYHKKTGYLVSLYAWNQLSDFCKYLGLNEVVNGKGKIKESMAAAIANL